MAYRIAGIDVHKKKLAVVVADVEVEEEYQFERRWYGSNPEQLQRLAEWLVEQEVEEVVMESTAQYWQGVWGALQRLGFHQTRNGPVMEKLQVWLIAQLQEKKTEPNSRLGQAISYLLNHLERADAVPAPGGSTPGQQHL